MSPRRTPAAPPELPGFTYRELLGSGGFADVFLYDQQLPHRRVAVKVLLAERLSGGSVSEFTGEANVMAMLSTHPAIVTIYQAGVAADGRPYLVMEYCPKPNLQARYRRERFSVAESLRVGVQVAGAVETAHRAGVLHRDIKPANILVTEYNRPALTDFGIASTTGAVDESAGLSIPWSPPESFADRPHSDRRSDVYALGATVYTLLAGRSPFELPGQRNGAIELIDRIESMPLPSLGRPDAPASLQRVFARAMAKNPADRFDTALEFARALQKVQIELSLAVTPIDILDDGGADDIVEDDDDGLTRVRGVVSIDPQTAPSAGLTRPADVARPGEMPAWQALPATDAGAGPARFTAAADTVRRAELPAAPPAGPATDDTRTPILETPAPPADTVTHTPPRTRHGLWPAIGAGVFVAALVIVAVVALPQLTGGAAPRHTATTAAPPEPQNPLPATVAAPTGLTGARHGGSVVWTWKNPDTVSGDVFLWRNMSRPDVPGTLQKASQATVTQPVDSSGRTCIEVRTLRQGGSSSTPVTGCVS